MQIDNNETEKRAMQSFHAGDRPRGLAIQDEFVAELHAFREQGGDHCTCKKACKFHGKCIECVAIHRAHGDHLPNCFHNMVNERVRALSALTEHSAQRD